MSKQNQSSLKPEKYLQSRARGLELGQCYISENWKSAGFATIIVSRKHKNSNITHALYQVDLLAQGLINTFFEFNLEASNYNKVIEHYTKQQELISCSYDLVHQILYKSIEFASEYKLKAHKDFKYTRYILESESYAVENEINISFGEDSKALIIISPGDDKKELIAHFKRNFDESEYKIVNIDELHHDHDHADEGHDHSHHHHDEEDAQVSFDLPPTINPKKDLDRENVENWTDKDWDDFEKGIKQVSAQTTLQIIDFMYNSHFVDSDISELINKSLLKIENLNISYDPIEENNFFKSEAEKQNINKIYMDALNHPSEDYINQLNAKFEENSENPHILSYISNIYFKLNKIEEAESWIKKAYEKFPDYLFSRISYAQTLLQKGENDEVPGVFDNKFDLKSLYPNRKQFHILEVCNFYSIMSLYFTTLKDIDSANVYWELLKELDERDEELVLLAENELMVEKAKVLQGA